MIVLNLKKGDSLKTRKIAYNALWLAKVIISGSYESGAIVFVQKTIGAQETIQ